MSSTARPSALDLESSLVPATRLDLELAELRFRSELDRLRHELTATFERELLVETRRMLFVISLLGAALTGVIISLLALARF